MKECQKCGAEYEYVIRKDKKRLQQILLQCPKCNHKRDLLHSEANEYCVFQMTDRDWKSKLRKER